MRKNIDSRLFEEQFFQKDVFFGFLIEDLDRYSKNLFSENIKKNYGEIIDKARKNIA